MKDFHRPIAGVSGIFTSRDDERLFEFVDTLRVSIKARVASEQLRGVPLSEIVVQVREMARLAEQDAPEPKPISSDAFRAIARQAVAWCIESYVPAVATEQDRSVALSEHPLPAALLFPGISADHFPSQSPS